MKGLLVGNYGVGNIGDEALKEYFLSAFPDIEWIVVSGHPKGTEVPRLPLGLRSLFSPWLAGRSSRRSVGWWRTLSAFKKCDAVVFGGGSLFTDVESVWACVMWRWYARVAKLFGKPYFLAFQGVGPWKTATGKRLAKKTFQNAAFVSVRDQKSFGRLGEWTMPMKPVLTFDPAFALFASHPPSAPAMKTLVIIPRTNADDAFYEAAHKKLSEGFDAVHILLMQPDAKERRVGDRLKALSPGSTVTEIGSVRQLLDEVSKASHVLTQRYHGAMAALALKVPFTAIPQSPGDKMDELQKAVLARPDMREEWLRLVEAGSDAFRMALQRLPKH